MSCVAIPPDESITKMMTSDDSTAANVFSTENFSTVSNTLPFFLMPAVSVNIKRSPLKSKSTDTASRVVPA